MSALKLTDEELMQFNREWATVEIRGEFCVLRVRDGVLYRVSDFRAAVAHVKRDAGRETIQLSSLWLEDERRRHYRDGVEFDPAKPPTFDWPCHDPPYAFNLWRGFAIKETDGDATPFLEFVFVIICNKDRVLFDYVIAWLADLVQNPANPPGTALVLRGPQGIGKSFFTTFLQRMFDVHFIELNNPSSLVGSFTGHFKGKVVVYADEGTFETARVARILKNMITSERLSIHEKFHTPYEVRNCLRLIISGNDEVLIRADVDERRYCVLDVSPAHLNDYPYFAGLAEWRDSGGAEAVLGMLRRHKSTVNLRSVPKTGALLAQKLASLDDFDRWWHDKLRKGDIGDDRPWAAPHLTYEVHNNFTDMTHRPHVGRATETEFGSKFAKRVSGLTRSRPTIERKQQWCYVLPPLDQCRAEFSARLGIPVEALFGEVTTPELAGSKPEPSNIADLSGTATA